MSISIDLTGKEFSTYVCMYVCMYGLELIFLYIFYFTHITRNKYFSHTMLDLARESQFNLFDEVCKSTGINENWFHLMDKPISSQSYVLGKLK